MPKLDARSFQSSLPHVFFGGDAAFGPKNIIWAVAHGHDAAISIHQCLEGGDLNDRPLAGMSLMSQKMGIHEWSYDNEILPEKRHKVMWADVEVTLKNVSMEVELGFDPASAWKEAQRCLNCDVQTVFEPKLCIECDACVDICPMDCISFVPDGEEADLRKRLKAPANNLSQSLYISKGLKTDRVMAKDEDVCLHCGLCAERCPTGAWDMQKSLIHMVHAAELECSKRHAGAALVEA
jgi:formate hydrogenlyase subunit 6/NADH:ubiquinone oxidoreductase subunit I